MIITRSIKQNSKTNAKKRKKVMKLDT